MDEQDSTVNLSSGATQASHLTWTCPSCELKIPTTTSICPQDGTVFDAKEQMDKTLADTYEFIGTIGTGGMGVIYKARQKMLNKVVAIKMLHSHLLNIQSMLRFQQEAKAASSLKHQNVISVHDFGISEQGQPYMVMDFIEGITLADLLRDRGSLPLPEAIDIFLLVCDALEHAHANGILHRDLKSSNIMLTEKDDGYDVHLLDFGIAKFVDTESGGLAQHLTQTGEMIGSPLYMSPEQCMGKKVDHRTDIYSLGCILYETVTGSPPHRGETILETIFKHTNETPQTPHQARPDIEFPAPFENLVMRLLATRPEDRVQTISEVKGELLSIQSGAIQGNFKRNLRSVRSKIKISSTPRTALICAILALLGLASLAVSFNNMKQAEEIKTESNKNLQQAEALNKLRYSAVMPKTAALGSNTLGQVSFDDLRGMNPYTESVNLSGKDFRENALLSLQRFPRLHSLNLSDTAISSYAVRPISSLKALTQLTLDGTQLSPDSLAAMVSMQSLREVYLNRTAADDSVLLALSKLPDLETLELRDTAITNRGLEYLVSAKKLKSLSISGTAVTNKGLASLGKIDLNTLNMWDISATAGALQYLTGCKNISSLSLSRIDLNTIDLTAISKMTNLTYLQLYHIKTLKDADLANLVPHKSLTELYFEHCPLTDGAAKYLNQMPQLKGLSVNNAKITDAFIPQISRLQNLEKLWLSGNSLRSFQSISKLKNIKELHISSTLLEDAGLREIASLPKLSSLEIWYCKNLNRKSIAAFRRAKPKCSLENDYSN